MRAYADRHEVIAFHTPGHKQGAGMESEFRVLVGHGALRMDLTELDELDDLHHPEGVIAEAQTLAAEAFGAEATYFLVNGATAGIHAMVGAVCNPGDALIVPADAHPAVAGGMTLAGARPVFLSVPPDHDGHLAPAVTPEAVAAALSAHPEARAVLVTSPTPFGVCADLAAIAQLCHALGKPLLVDESHGAHFHFHRGLPPSAMACGADMAVQATHETLPALAQAAMLHMRGERVSRPRVRNVLQLIQSSSPNYLLMASLDTARRQMAVNGQGLLDGAIALAHDARHRLGALPGLQLLGPVGHVAVDPTRLTVRVTALGLTGFQVQAQLRARDIQPEAAAPDHVRLVIGLGTTVRDVERLVAAFTAIATGAAHAP
jgi:arginine/lysine/ornithine decarboxylase